MDCRTALEMLDVCPVEGTPPDDPGVLSAAEHVRLCAECERTLLRRRTLDERIGRLLRDVPVPEGLKDDLLNTVSQGMQQPEAQETLVEPWSVDHGAGFCESVPASQRPALSEATEGLPENPVTDGRGAAESGDPRRARRRLETALTTAACLLVGLAVWYLSGLAHPQYSLADLQQRTTWELTELPEYTGDFEVRLPAGWPPEMMQLSSAPKGWPAEAHSHQIALYEFRLRSRGRSWRGVLLVAPKRRVAPIPSAGYFTTAGIEYVSNSRGRFATATWSEGEFVYICAVDGGADVMEALQHALQRAPA